MIAWWKKQIKNHGFLQPCGKNSLKNESDNLIFQVARLHKSTLKNDEYMFHLEIGLEHTKSNILSTLEPEQDNVIILTYWMDSSDITPIDWGVAESWHPDDKESMMECFQHMAIEWFNKYSQVEYLVTIFEEWKATGVPSSPRWPEEPSRFAPIHDLYLSVLYAHLGETSKSKPYLHNWCEFIGKAPVRKEEYLRCLNLL